MQFRYHAGYLHRSESHHHIYSVADLKIGLENIDKVFIIFTGQKGWRTMKQVQFALSIRVFSPIYVLCEVHSVITHAIQKRPPTSYGSGLLEWSILIFLQILTGLNNAKSFWGNDSPKLVDIILGYSVPENIDRLEGFQRKVTDVFKALKGLIYGRKLPEIKMNIILKLWPTQNELGGWCDNNVWGFWKVQGSFMERNSYAGHPRAKIVGCKIMGRSIREKMK